MSNSTFGYRLYASFTEFWPDMAIYEKKTERTFHSRGALSAGRVAQR